jgi:hypothetical protein
MANTISPAAIAGLLQGFSAATLALSGCTSSDAPDPNKKGPDKTPAGAASPGEADEAKKNCCVGKNDCKAKGGCKTAANECAGKNDCKGKGGCSMRDCK